VLNFKSGFSLNLIETNRDTEKVKKRGMWGGPRHKIGLQIFLCIT
jgi:hypothetical protein